MSNHRADPAVIESIVRLGIIEWRLQNAGGKNYFVVLRVVIGVNCRRRHAPFRLVYRFADFSQRPLELKLAGRDKILVVRPSSYRHSFVITPLVRITDLSVVRLKFADRFLTRFATHPT